MAAKTSRVLLFCTCALLAAAVAVAVVAVLFHPQKSETSRIIAELESKLHCVHCSKAEERHKESCQPCFSSFKQKVDDCNLDGTRLSWISRIVSAVKARTAFATSLLTEPNKSWLGKLSNMRLNARRPSAHWYLKHGGTESEEDAGKQYKKISRWFSETTTNTKQAHSKNGISNMNSLMKFNTSGWYHIYFQTEIHSNVSSDFRYQVRAAIENPKKKKLYLMQQEETVDCALRHKKHQNHRDLTATETHGHRHPCVKLKASVVHQVFAGDKLKLEADIPNEASFGSHMSRSYMGALYLHQPPNTF